MRWALFWGVLLNLSGCFLLCGPVLSSICYIHHTDTHTHRHTNKLKMMGFSLHPRGRVDPCTRLNLTLTTSSDRGRKYHGWERGGGWELNGAIRVKRGVQWLVWSDRLIRPFLREALFSYLLQNIRRPNSTLTLTSIDYIANTHTLVRSNLTNPVTWNWQNLKKIRLTLVSKPRKEPNTNKLATAPSADWSWVST